MVSIPFIPFIPVKTSMHLYPCFGRPAVALHALRVIIFSPSISRPHLGERSRPFVMVTLHIPGLSRIKAG
jgi:hypothetical protein